MGDDEGSDKLFFCLLPLRLFVPTEEGEKTIIDLIGTFFFLPPVHFTLSTSLQNTSRELIRLPTERMNHRVLSSRSYRLSISAG